MVPLRESFHAKTNFAQEWGFQDWLIAIDSVAELIAHGMPMMRDSRTQSLFGA